MIHTLVQQNQITTQEVWQHHLTTQEVWHRLVGTPTPHSQVMEEVALVEAALEEVFPDIHQMEWVET